MTQEEKAKAYDEALERARELSKEVTGARYDHIFPELKESDDEKIRKDIIEFIKRNHKPFAPVPSDSTLDKWINWLEKQKPVEWSEDDEAARKDIIDKLERINMAHVGSECEICQMEIGWLKSLSPQSHWKPSEEQKEALKGELYSLYEQLKAL